jgi:colicin import membrane protein
VEASSRFEFQPLQPRQGLLRSYGLALLVHGLLLAALTWGVSWRRSDTSLSVEAELWSAVPQQAAPRLLEPEPEPQPEPAPPPAPPKMADPGPNDAEIALQRERERDAKEKAEQERREKQRLERERQEKLERERQEREKKLAEEKRRKELEAKRKEQQEAELREKLRQENIKRMAGLANATGKPTDTGTAIQTSGISTSYAGRIRARIKPNIAFLDELPNNPEAHVVVHTAPDGTILSGEKDGPKLVKSSGNKAWDDAVLKAITKTDKLPRNEDGVVPSPMTIIFRPKD